MRVLLYIISNLYFAILLLLGYSCSEKEQYYMNEKVQAISKSNNFAINDSSYFTATYNNGNIKAAGWLKSGLKCDWWKYYYENGLLEREEYYNQNCILTWCVEFNIKGIKIFEGHYNGEKKDGYSKYYHNNGHLWKQGYYFYNELSDWWSEYDTTGILLWEGNFYNGMKKGYFMYYQNGLLEREGMYYNNIEKGEWKYYKKGEIVKIDEYF